MGTTLQNGVYLPNEGERNCYAGLKTNWEILDQKVADVTALQQAVAGALHREIVESLPTTDIDPNTIYMILSGTSATENVYDEYMYVNNAWELIGTSATDLTNYYTKGDVDGLLLLKANASDLTSHTGDTTIHVTASDKSKWNTVALIKQLRLVNAQVGSATTIAFANIDDTNGIKVGDKCMDLDAKMFEITAVDTTNQTVTVGSALIDLAQDSDVVHKSGNETVGGSKTFDSNTYIYNSDNTATTPNLYLRSSKIEISSQGNTSGDQNLTYLDKNNTTYAYVKGAIQSNGSAVKIRTVAKDSSDNSVVNELQMLAYTNGNKAIFPLYSNEVDLGISSYKWKSVYATNYYYGSNNVEFSTKFVTTDTTQTITESKTFTNTIKSQKEIEFTGNRLAYILPEFSASYSGLSLCTYGSNGAVKIGTWKVDDNDNTKHVLDTSLGFLNVSTGSVNSVNIVYLTPKNTTNSKLGDSTNKWKEINGLTPSSLSLPSNTGYVDISGYFTNTGDGQTNSYTALANGWVYLFVTACKTLTAYIQTAADTLYADYRERSSDGQIRIMLPIQKNNKFTSFWTTSTNVSITKAVFIPCQGNI